jgi:hypothetical protein
MGSIAFEPPFDASDPRAPKYWRYETSGELAIVVGVYLCGERPLTLREIALMRAYVKQWILSPVWDLNPAITDESRAELDQMRQDAGRIASESDLRAWLRRADENGLDPL